MQMDMFCYAVHMGKVSRGKSIALPIFYFYLKTSRWILYHHANAQGSPAVAKRCKEFLGNHDYKIERKCINAYFYEIIEKHDS